MRWTGIVVASVMAVACGGGSGAGALSASGAAKGGPRTATGEMVAAHAKKGFEEALSAFMKYDSPAEGWSESKCQEVAGQFVAAAEEQEDEVDRAFPEALYNAGLVYQRCGDDGQARAQFQAAAAAGRGEFHAAKAQLTLYDYAKSEDLNSAISRLEDIIRAAKFQNVEALVNLAALQMERAAQSDESAAKADYDAAKLNIQRALALDDSYMPAFNQLAVYYLELARANASNGKANRRRRGRMVVAGKTAESLNQQQIELAALVAAQAIQKNPGYAPIYNTMGLIQVEQRNFNTAVRSFAKARSLDPRFFEAHMNYGALNLVFRGFAEAEKAYGDALRLNEREYEAHLGLALAVRGQINDQNFDRYTTLVEKHLADAKQIAPNRPETYYNEAIFMQEYRAKRGSEAAQIQGLRKVKTVFQTFINKAGADPAFADAVKRSKERVQDIDDIIPVLQMSIDDQKRMKAEAAAKAAAVPAASPAGAAKPAQANGAGAEPN